VKMPRSLIVKTAGRLGLWGYLFFLSIAFMGDGMKSSFKEPLKAYLHEHAADFTELVSFVIGVLGTSLVQSSSTVTSIAVTLSQDGVVPLLIAIGIVHGANLGTSVTSSLVAFVAETRPLTGQPMRDLYTLLFSPRLPGFRRAVQTAVVHGLFNAIMVTGILLAFELPFGLIHSLSQWTAERIGGALAGSGHVLDVLDYLSPDTYAKPVSRGLLHLGLPGGLLVLLGFVLLFQALKGFSTTMKSALMHDVVGDGELPDVEALGRKLLGHTPMDTFLRGLILTILVQSSSATTSMVVPLAAMGFFSLRQVFPFIMGANIGTTTTALLAASTAVGQPGFEAGLTIALSHFYLNTIAVILVATVPGLQHSIIGTTSWLASMAERVPAALLGYLFAMSVGVPALIFFTPDIVARVVLSAVVGLMVFGPHIFRAPRRLGAEAVVDVPSDDARAA